VPLAALLLFTGLLATASAQTGSADADAVMEATATTSPASAEAMAKAQVEAEANLAKLETPSVVPGNVFYGLKLVWEGFVDFFASGRAKIERRLERAEERMAEAVAVEVRGNAKAAAKAAVRAQAKVEAASGDLEEEADALEGEARAELYVRARNAYNMLVTLIERLSVDADAKAELNGQVNALGGLSTALDRVRARMEAGTEDISASMRVDIEEGARLEAGSGAGDEDADDGASVEGGARGGVEVDTGAGTGTVDLDGGAGAGL
jgi:hypothetical protein